MRWDLVVEGTIVLELKAVTALSLVMEAQIINYLRLSRLPVGYLLNFANTRVEWRRFVNQRQRGWTSTMGGLSPQAVRPRPGPGAVVDRGKNDDSLARFPRVFRQPRYVPHA